MKSCFKKCKKSIQKKIKLKKKKFDSAKKKYTKHTEHTEHTKYTKYTKHTKHPKCAQMILLKTGLLVPIALCTFVCYLIGVWNVKQEIKPKNKLTVSIFRDKKKRKSHTNSDGIESPKCMSPVVVANQNVNRNKSVAYESSFPQTIHSTNRNSNNTHNNQRKNFLDLFDILSDKERFVLFMKLSAETFCTEVCVFCGPAFCALRFVFAVYALFSVCLCVFVFVA